MTASDAWEATETLSNPPQICEHCQEQIEDGQGWLSTGEHLLCKPCWMEREG